MMNEPVLFAVEIGRENVRVLAGYVGARGVTLAGQGSCPAWGVSEDGALVDPLQLAESIRSALLEAEDEAGERAASVYAAVPATLLREVEASGCVRIEATESGAVGARRAQEVARASTESGFMHLQTRLSRVTVEPVRSDGDAAADALEFTASYTIFGVHASDLAPYRRAIELCGLDVEALTVAPLAAIDGALTPEERERGAILLHMDGSRVDVATCRGGVVQYATTTTLAHLAAELERTGGLDLLPGTLVLSGEDAEGALDGSELGLVVPVRVAGADLGAQSLPPSMTACVGLVTQAASALAPAQLQLLASA